MALLPLCCTTAQITLSYEMEPDSFAIVQKGLQKVSGNSGDQVGNTASTEVRTKSATPICAPQVAVYCDEAGKQHAFSAVCPHMGCLLHVRSGGRGGGVAGRQRGEPGQAFACPLLCRPPLLLAPSPHLPQGLPTLPLPLPLLCSSTPWRRRLTAPATAPTLTALARSSTVSRPAAAVCITTCGNASSARRGFACCAAHCGSAATAGPRHCLPQGQPRET